MKRGPTVPREVNELQFEITSIHMLFLSFSFGEKGWLDYINCNTGRYCIPMLQLH